jgi:hypothetical protein
VTIILATTGLESETIEETNSLIPNSLQLVVDLLVDAAVALLFCKG